MTDFFVATLMSLAQVAWSETTYGPGSNGCKCLAEFPAGFENTGYWTPDGANLRFEDATTNPPTTRTLPPHYGLGCHEWDLSIEGLCTDETTGISYTGNNLPAWCSEPFCFVDPESCDFLPYESGFFRGSGLYYSYQTCGGENHFAKSWAAANMDTDELLDEIVASVDRVEKSFSQTWQDLVEGTALGDYSCTGAFFEQQPSCGCEWDNVCKPASVSSDWTSCTDSEKSSGDCSGDKIFSLSYKTNSLVFAEKERASDNPKEYYDGTGPSVSAHVGNYSMTQCIGQALNRQSLREVQKLYSDPNYVAYIYSATQHDGTLIQWPAVSSCNDGDFDPRFRPWYASTVSGPKNVVAVLDVSGSMNTADRWTKTKIAVDKLLKTLTENDRFQMVLFNDDAWVPRTSYDEKVLHPADAAFKEAIYNALPEKGQAGTNFEAGLRLAYRILSNTHAVEGQNAGPDCQDMILFMTDGVDASWQNHKFGTIQCDHSHLDPTIFSYGFGSGATDVEPLVLFAKNTGGIYYQVGDDVDLGDKMAEYYNYFVQATPSSQMQFQKPTFIRYADSFTGVELFAACKASFYVEGNIKDFTGVSCV